MGYAYNNINLIGIVVFEMSEFELLEFELSKFELSELELSEFEQSEFEQICNKFIKLIIYETTSKSEFEVLVELINKMKFGQYRNIKKSKHLKSLKTIQIKHNDTTRKK